MLTEAVEDARQILHSRFLAARNETDALFQIVRPEAMYDRPIPERHRIAFYGSPRGVRLESLRAPVPRRLSSIGFCVRIDPVDEIRRPMPGDWPELPIIYEYRDQTVARVDELIQRTSRSLTSRLNTGSCMPETLAYIFHQPAGAGERWKKTNAATCPNSNDGIRIV